MDRQGAETSGWMMKRDGEAGALVGRVGVLSVFTVLEPDGVLPRRNGVMMSRSDRLQGRGSIMTETRA